MKNLLILPALACGFLAPAATQSPAPPAGIVGIAHIALRVSDLDREIAFLGKLGYEESFALPGAGKIMAVLVKIDDSQFIELVPRTAPAQPLGWIHVSFQAANIDTLVKHLNSAGLRPSPVRRTQSGNLVSSLRDPDGHVVEFTEYLPGSRHMLDRGRHIGANRVATELLGVDLPVANLAAEKQFYVNLGLEAEDADSGVHLTAAGAPDLRIELRPAHPGAQPQLLFPVADARKAADRLKDVGARRDKKIALVRDPDGNSFIFLETGAARAGRMDRFMPWRH